MAHTAVAGLCTCSPAPEAWAFGIDPAHLGASRACAPAAPTIRRDAIQRQQLGERCIHVCCGSMNRPCQHERFLFLSFPFGNIRSLILQFLVAEFLQYIIYDSVVFQMHEENEPRKCIYYICHYAIPTLMNEGDFSLSTRCISPLPGADKRLRSFN